MAPCHHRIWKYRACRDATHLCYACQDCRRIFLLPLLMAKPRLRWVKQALRMARGMTDGPVRFAEVPCLAQDVWYLHGFLLHAGIRCEVPQFSSVLLVRGGRRAP